MSTSNTVICRDIYLRHTDGNGNSTVQCHRVWDAERFIASQVAMAKNESSKAYADDKPYMHKVEQVLESDYLEWRARK